MLARPRYPCLIAAGYLIAGTTLLILLALLAGLSRLAANTGGDDLAIVLPRAALVDEGARNISPEQVGIVSALPGIARDRDGRTMTAPQFVAYARIRSKDGPPGSVLIRGVTPEFFRVIDDRFRIVSGRLPRAGNEELVAGIGASDSFVALDPGSSIKIRRSSIWHACGTFVAGGGFWESELWTSADALRAAYGNSSDVTSIWIKLSSPGEYDVLAKALRSDPRLESLSVHRQPDFYAAQSGFLEHFAYVAILVVSVALGSGAILASANSIAIALRGRRRELAVMRALGFRRRDLAISLMLEVWLIGLLSTSIVVLMGAMFWDGHAIDSATFGRAVHFEAALNCKVALLTLAYILALGIFAAILPIRKVVVAPLVTSLRDE
jgi:putative ABC transport system permease protein